MDDNRMRFWSLRRLISFDASTAAAMPGFSSALHRSLTWKFPLWQMLVGMILAAWRHALQRPWSTAWSDREMAKSQ
jgi:hypothetical protein